MSWFIRILGISQWGLLALFQAAVAPLALLEGLGTATVKYASEALGRQDRPGATKVVQTTVLLNLALGCAGMLGLFASARWLATSVFAIPLVEVERAVGGFRIIAVVWFFTVTAATYSAVLAAHQRYDAIAQLGVASFILSTAAGLLAARWTRNILWVLLAQAAVAGVMAYVNFRRAAGLLPGLASRPRLDGPSVRRSGRFWGWQLVAAVGSLATAWADRYILGAYFVPAVVGFYAIANMLLTQVYVAFYEMAEVLFPAVSALEGQGELPAARRLALLAGWTLTSGFGVCAAVLAVVGSDFVHLWISPDAARATSAMLRVLCVGGIAGMTAIAPLQYVLGVGETRWNAFSGAVAGVLVVGLGFALVPRYGLTGIGYGLLVAALARWVFVLLIWREHFSREFRFGEFAEHVWTPPLISIATLLVAVQCHDRIDHVPSWPWFAVETLLSLSAIAAVQLILSELLPGGARRRRDVAASLKPILAKALSAIPGR